ncbi:MAG: TonB-dependent receptor [Bacteroidota bacterium]
MRFKILLCLVLITQVAWAQRPGGGRGGYGGGPKIMGKVTGVLVDSATNEALPFASVVLSDPKTKKDVNGVVTGEDGSFKLTNVPVGSYVLKMSFVGYELKTFPVQLTPKNPDFSFKNIKLKSTSTILSDVVVEGEQELIVNKIDKIVYNAERDVANAGGDASDVLRRAPLLSVDLEGNVSLRGNSNVQILVNGKPSSMFATNPADALRVIPADQIKSVEVITTPSAKYDGEGTAGIINIITKKKTIQGIQANLNASVGVLSNRGVLGVNGGKGRFGFNANGSTFYSWPRNGSTTFLREDFIDDQTRTLAENGTSRSTRLGFFGSGGLFYDFNAYHSLSSSFRVRGFKSNNDATFNTIFVDPFNNLDQNYQRSSLNESLFSGYELSLDYVIKFPKHKDRELSFAYKLDGNVQNQDFEITQMDLIGNDLSLFRDERNDNDGDNDESTIQVDYVHPVNKNFKLETGIKAVIRDVRSDFIYEIFDTEANVFEVAPGQTDLFSYDQDVAAAYVSGNFKIGKNVGLVAGARYEYTSIEGRFRDIEQPFQNDYENWLPSIILSRKVGKLSTVKTSYNRRIQRPGLRFINPYVQLDNNRNVSQGNPELRPELTDQYEVSYSTFFKKSSINASLYFRRTSDIIESFLDVDAEGISNTTFRNIGERNSVGLNLFTSTTLLKVWTIRGGINLFTYNASGRVDGRTLTNDAILFSGNLNSNIKLKKGWIIDMFGFYRARRQTLQGFNPSFSIFSMGFRKSMWDDKGSLGVRIVEPFFANKVFGSELSGPNYFQFSERSIPFRSFGVNVTYKFGKLDFRQRQRRSRIRNDDLKQGDNDGQNQF